ncbi:hypothetical protein W911_14295 [Hyphomicrobium nitrativorans NL23]|uniref:Uncharacterized protein n=1 Tax=Hyphomicrobium nitrativorans NL23 TaxID=1029756 RepID=V5SHJ0_9HYPH|nr:hypothetical protein [Hyphomicrobium nitrativorans]AHB50316.1 hypothetical protein W911_14295 [Hyphomicrobium nitrativorans NL23]
MLFHGPLHSMALFEPSSTDGFAEQIFVSDTLTLVIDDSFSVKTEEINRETPDGVILRIGIGSVRIKIREA